MSVIAAIKDQVSIVAIAEQHMVLKRYGQRYKILCPYHSEKSPSFVIYSSTNRFKCFGCGRSGDQIDLYSRLNGIDNKAAVKQLAAIYGVDSTTTPGPSRYEVERLLNKERTKLRLMIGTYLFQLEELYFDSPVSSEVERDFYQEFSRLEYWLENLDQVNEYTIRKMGEAIPKYLSFLYTKFWGRGNVG